MFRFNRHGAFAVVVALLLFTSTSRLTAQAPNSVSGLVTDSAGRALANVNVVLSPLNRTTTTDAAGHYNFGVLVPATYHLTAFLIGYAPTHFDVTVTESGLARIPNLVLRSTTVQLSVVQVTATPLPTDPRDVSQSTVELSGQALSRNLGNTVSQTLSREPGISERFAGPAANTPVIRGLSGERVLVLQDGQRTADLSATSSDHSLSVDPLASERVEVVRGPASLLYGNNALGGVVNVISNDIPTTVPSHMDGYLAGQLLSVTPGGAAAGSIVAPVGENVAFVARGGVRRVEDMRQGEGLVLSNSYFHNLNGVLGLSHIGEKANAGIAWRGYSFQYGLPAPADDAEAGVHIEGRRNEVFGSSDIQVNSTAIQSLKVNGSAQWYKHDEIESTGEIGTTFNLRTQTGDVMARTNFGNTTGAIGGSVLFRQYQPTGEEALTPPANSNTFGVFVYEDIPFSAATNPDVRIPRLQIGARYDAYRIETKEADEKFGAPAKIDLNNFSGSVGLSLPVSEVATFAVSAARAFRAPTVEELFSNAFHAAVGTFDVGNRSLKSETNQGFDAVLRLGSTTVTGQFGAYYNQISNFILGRIVKDTVVDGETVPLNQFSQVDANLKGIEGKLELEVAPHFVLGGVGDMVRGELKAGGALPYIPAARIGGLSRWDNGIFSVDAEVTHAFMQDRVPAGLVEDDPASIATDSYNLVDVSLGYNFSSGGLTHSLTLRGDNLLDTKYREATSRIKNFAFNPGRNISLVYKVLF